MGGILGTIASVIGIGSGVKNLTSGSQQGGSSNSNAYVPTGLGTADQTWQGALTAALQQAQQSGAQISPALLQGFQQMMNVPTQGLTGAANYAGQMYGNLANTAQGYQQTMQGQAGQNYANQAPLLAAGNSVWNAAQDPQNALRNQLQQQVTDASRAGSSARGIGMGGEGAGMESQAINDFLNQWQQQQLARQVQGAQAMGTAYGQAGQQGTAGNQALMNSMQMGALAPTYAASAGSTPYDAQMQVAQTPFNAAQQYQQGSQGIGSQYGGILSSIIPYLNSGQGATTNLFNQQQTGLNSLTTGLNQLGKSPIFTNFQNPFSQPAASGNTMYGGDYVPNSGGPP